MEKGRCCDCDSNNDSPNTIKDEETIKIAVNITLDLYPNLPFLLSINTLCRIVSQGSYIDYGKVIEQGKSRLLKLIQVIIDQLLLTKGLEWNILTD